MVSRLTWASSALALASDPVRGAQTTADADRTGRYASRVKSPVSAQRQPLELSVGRQSRKDRLSRALASIAALGSLLIAGCAVGPDFKRPAAPDVSDYTSASALDHRRQRERRRRRSAALCQGSDIAARLVDPVSFQAAQRADRTDRSPTIPTSRRRKRHCQWPGKMCWRSGALTIPASRQAFRPAASSNPQRHSRPCRTQTPSTTISSRRRSAFRMCPMFSA